jgi:uncharacterized protein YsxB (DUF464 family)
MTTIDMRENIIRVYGHSGYAERGHDIVCAAISTLTEATYNYLVATKNKVNNQESNGVYIINIEALNKQGKAIIDSFIDMVQDLINQYPHFLTWRRV